VLDIQLTDANGTFKIRYIYGKKIGLVIHITADDTVNCRTGQFQIFVP